MQWHLLRLLLQLRLLPSLEMIESTVFDTVEPPCQLYEGMIIDSTNPDYMHTLRPRCRRGYEYPLRALMSD